MKFVSAAKYAALQTRCDRLAREVEDAEKRDAGRLATIRGLRAEIERLRDEHPDSPVRQPKPPVGDADLKRRLDLALHALREMQDRVDVLQASHIADTRELHDLRQGVAS